MKDLENILDKESYDILLIHPSYHRRRGSGVVPPIGLAYLTSSLNKAGFTSKIIDCALHFDSLSVIHIAKMKKWLHEELNSTYPKLAIGIGPCTTSAIRSIISIVDICTEFYPSTPIIFGGPLTLIPDLEWLFFDRLNASAVIRGDGEYALNHILNKLQKANSISNITGVQTLKNQQIEPHFIEDIDSLPYPEWDIFNISLWKPSIRRDIFIYPFAPIIGSRGCEHKCNFCISGQLIEYRRHSFEYIAEEVNYMHEKYNINSFIFYDDSLFQSKSTVNTEISRFAELISKKAPDVFWQIEMRPDIFSQISDDKIKKIFSCGCRQINIGIEKVSKLKTLSKSYQIDQLREQCNLVAKTCPTLRLTGTFILGGPEETLESIQETIQFSTELNLIFAHYYPLELYPGTPIYNSVFEQDNKVWFNKIINDELPWGEIIYESADISAEQLMNLVHLAYNRFYNRQEWQKIAKNHLGENYNEILKTVESWYKDRFRIGQEDEI